MEIKIFVTSLFCTTFSDFFLYSKKQNNEFEWYTADNENSFARNGKLQIKPTLTADKIGEYEVEHGHVHLDDCTDTDNSENCDRQAGGNVIINPIRSARLNTRESFKFKYGKLEIVAKTPRGDWLWPGLWLLAVEDNYDGWTGEIDVMESRGNDKYVSQFESTLHFGQLATERHKSVDFENVTRGAKRFDKVFHKYGLLWDDNGITFLLDDAVLGSVPVQDGYWQQTNYTGPNPWASGTRMTPFDQEVCLLRSQKTVSVHH